MTDTYQVDLARRLLHRHEYTNTVKFRGVTLDHFDAEELRKIVEISMEQAESQKNFYDTAINGFRALNKKGI